jgi:hypothetical protein
MYWSPVELEDAILSDSEQHDERTLLRLGR